MLKERKVACLVDQHLAGTLDGDVQFIRVGGRRYLVVRSPDQKGWRLDPAHLVFGQAAKTPVTGSLHTLNRIGRAKAQDQVLFYQPVGDEAVVEIQLLQIFATLLERCSVRDLPGVPIGWRGAVRRGLRTIISTVDEYQSLDHLRIVHCQM